MTAREAERPVGQRPAGPKRRISVRIGGPSSPSVSVEVVDDEAVVMLAPAVATRLDPGGAWRLETALARTREAIEQRAGRTVLASAPGTASALWRPDHNGPPSVGNVAVIPDFLHERWCGWRHRCRTLADRPELEFCAGCGLFVRATA